jgi:hypothetical protein
MGKRGDFGKAFGDYRKSGGTMSRSEFGAQWKLEHPKPAKVVKKKAPVETQTV